MKNKIIVVALFIVAVFLVSGCINNTTTTGDTNTGTPEATDTETGLEYTDISAAEAKQLMEDNPDLIVIDVSPHYDAGHLPGAVSYYPLTALDGAISTLDMDATYLVYCHADGPSMAGAQALIDAGFENVYRLEGNYAAWIGAGYDVEQ